MEEMMEQAMPHVKYYISFSYDHGSVIGSASVNLADVDRMSVEFFKDNIQHSYKNNIHYSVEVVLEYPTTRSSRPYEVKLIDEPLFDYDVDYELVKNKTMGQCVLDSLNKLEMDRYNEFTATTINGLKNYLGESVHQLNR